jgi:flagellar hook-length control protein FliK
MADALKARSDDNADATTPAPTQPDPTEKGRNPATAPDSLTAPSAPVPISAMRAEPTPATSRDIAGNAGAARVVHPDKLPSDPQAQMPIAANPSTAPQHATRPAPLGTSGVPSKPDPLVQLQTADGEGSTTSATPLSSMTKAPVAVASTRHLAGSAETSVLLRAAADGPGSATFPEKTAWPVPDRAGSGGVAVPTAQPISVPVTAVPAAPVPATTNPSPDLPQALDSGLDPAPLTGRTVGERVGAEPPPQTRQPSMVATHHTDPPSHVPAAPGDAAPEQSVPSDRHPARTAEAAVLMRASDQALASVGPDPAPLQGATAHQTKATPAPLDSGIVAQAPSTDATPVPQPSTNTNSPVPSTASTATAPSSTAPPLPPATAPAIVLAATQSGAGIVELVLTPADLGRLRFEITQTGDQMRIHLIVERPETLEMLRRNADQLLSEFRQAGYAGATLSFAQGGQGGQQQHPPPPSATAHQLPPLPEQQSTAPKPQSQPQGKQPGGGLDLRL